MATSRPMKNAPRKRARRVGALILGGLALAVALAILLADGGPCDPPPDEPIPAAKEDPGDR